MAFVMVLPRRPVSVQGGPNKKYKEALSQAAAIRMQGIGMLDGSLYARIIWFHRVKTSQDIDNIVKPILDSLKGVVYKDDFQIEQCLATRIDLQRSYVLSDRDVDAGTYQEIVEMIAFPYNDILYIEIGPMALNQVVFGPIDGGVQ